MALVGHRWWCGQSMLDDGLDVFGFDLGGLAEVGFVKRCGGERVDGLEDSSGGLMHERERVLGEKRRERADRLEPAFDVCRRFLLFETADGV